jgi:hypothetical protein
MFSMSIYRLSSGDHPAAGPEFSCARAPSCRARVQVWRMCFRGGIALHLPARDNNITTPPLHTTPNNRWHNHLSPAVKKAPFSDYEDAVIIRVRFCVCFFVLDCVCSAVCRVRESNPLPTPSLPNNPPTTTTRIRRTTCTATSGRVSTRRGRGGGVVECGTTRHLAS